MSCYNSSSEAAERRLSCQQAEKHAAGNGTVSKTLEHQYKDLDLDPQQLHK